MFRTVSIFLFSCIASSLWATDVDSILTNLGAENYTARQQARVDLMQRFAEASPPSAQAEVTPALELATLQAIQTDLPLAQRLYCIRMLQLFGSDVSAKELSTLLYDQEKEIRDSARRALAVISSDNASQYLVTAFAKASNDERPLYIDALTRRGDHIATSAIIEALQSDDPELLTSAIVALGKLGQNAEALAALKTVWSTASETERPLIENAMLSIGLDAEAAYLISKTSSSTAVRVAAFRQLARLDSEQASKALKHALSAKHSTSRALILREAMAHGSETMRDDLVEYMPNASADEQMILVAAIGELELRQYESAVLTFFSNADQALKPTIIKTLGSVGSDSSFEVLYQAFEANPKDLVLAVALAQIKAPAIDQKALETAVHGTDDQSRVSAIKLLKLRNTQGATELLNTIAAQPGKSPVKGAAFKGLELIDNFESIKILITLVLNDDEMLRPAQQSLKRLSINFGVPDFLWDELYQPALESAANDQVRRSIVLILDGVPGPLCLSYLEGLAKDGSPELSDAAIRTLARWPNIYSANFWWDMLINEDASAKQQANAQRALKRLLYNKDITGAKKDKLLFSLQAIQEAPTAELKDFILGAYESGLHWQERQNIRTIFEPLKSDPDVGDRVTELLDF